MPSPWASDPRCGVGRFPPHRHSPSVRYVHGTVLYPCPEPTEDLILRIYQACNGWGYDRGGLNKADVWLVLEMAARRGHISFKGRARGGGLGVRRKSHLLRKTLKKNINGVTISWMGRVLGQAETCQSRIHAV